MAMSIESSCLHKTAGAINSRVCEIFSDTQTKHNTVIPEI